MELPVDLVGAFVVLRDGIEGNHAAKLIGQQRKKVLRTVMGPDGFSQPNQGLVPGSKRLIGRGFLRRLRRDGRSHVCILLSHAWQLAPCPIFGICQYFGVGTRRDAQAN
jgi:hypothetical protein